MAPEIVEEAMRAYAEETNRLNRERRSSGDAWKAELIKVEKQIRGIIEAIKAGMFHESMKAEMDTLEARKTELNTLLADAPEDAPDILPSASAIYAKKVSALTMALNRKEERQKAHCRYARVWENLHKQSFCQNQLMDEFLCWSQDRAARHHNG